MENAEEQQKEQFVREWLRTRDPYKAAIRVFPSDDRRAIRAASEWQLDAWCRTRYHQLLNIEGEASFLPDKHELAREVYTAASEKNNGNEFAHSARDRERLYRLTAEILGYIEKPIAVKVTDETTKPKLPSFVIAKYEEPAG